jgi:hypothetical protein
MSVTVQPRLLRMGIQALVRTQNHLDYERDLSLDFLRRRPTMRRTNFYILHSMFYILRLEFKM